MRDQFRQVETDMFCLTSILNRCSGYIYRGGMEKVGLCEFGCVAHVIKQRETIVITITSNGNGRQEG